MGCTGGFFVRSQSDNKPYLMTGGHCLYGALGAWWYTLNSVGATRYYGQAHNAIRDAGGDVGIIKVTDPYWSPLPSPTVAAWTGNELHPVTGAGYSYYGQFTCRFGAMTAVRCGWNGVPNGSVAINYCAAEGGYCPVVVNHMTASSNCAIPGDSGGPVMAYNTAYGITDAAVGCPTAGSWYMEAIYAAAAVNVYYP